MEQYYVCSLSGGKDSTAMFLELIRRKYPLDEVVYCDVGMEFPAMEEHIEKLRNVAEQHGIKFTTLKSDKTFEYYMNEYLINKRDGTTQRGWSWPGPRMRWCTSKLKTEVIDRHTSNLRKSHDVYHYIGIALDEEKRLERVEAKQSHKLYPLVEWGMTEADCLQYCYDHGFDWGGYTKSSRECPVGAVRYSRSENCENSANTSLTCGNGSRIWITTQRERSRLDIPSKTSKSVSNLRRSLR